MQDVTDQLIIDKQDGVGRITFVQRPGAVLQSWRAVGPIVEGGLQGRRDIVRRPHAGKIVADHDEPAVAAMFERSQFHAPILCLCSITLQQAVPGWP